MKIDESAWSSLYRTESRPFVKPSTGKIAIKVINHYGLSRQSCFARISGVQNTSLTMYICPLTASEIC